MSTIGNAQQKLINRFGAELPQLLEKASTNDAGAIHLLTEISGLSRAQVLELVTRVIHFGAHQVADREHRHQTSLAHHRKMPDVGLIELAHRRLARFVRAPDDKPSGHHPLDRRPCRIETIRPLDVKALKQAQKELREAKMVEREAAG